MVALAQVYGRPLEDSGPEYASMGVEGPAVRLHFRHADGLRPSDGGPLRRFAVAGEDRRFAWAEATVAGPTVVVSSPDVPRPVAARYAWASSPESATSRTPPASRSSRSGPTGGRGGPNCASEAGHPAVRAGPAAAILGPDASSCDDDACRRINMSRRSISARPGRSRGRPGPWRRPARSRPDRAGR